jgi:hypothetical protein
MFPHILLSCIILQLSAVTGDLLLFYKICGVVNLGEITLVCELISICIAIFLFRPLERVQGSFISNLLRDTKCIRMLYQRGDYASLGVFWILGNVLFYFVNAFEPSYYLEISSIDSSNQSSDGTNDGGIVTDDHDFNGSVLASGMLLSTLLALSINSYRVNQVVKERLPYLVLCLSVSIVSRDQYDANHLTYLTYLLSPTLSLALEYCPSPHGWFLHE